MDPTAPKRPAPVIAIPTEDEPASVRDDVGVDRNGQRAPRDVRSLLPIAIAFAVALLGLVMWFLTRVPGSLQNLPPRERTALYERTLANLHDVCRASGRPREFCKDQATLLLSLPECDQACQADARQELLADMAVK
jgi:hypothetical protein